MRRHDPLSLLGTLGILVVLLTIAAPITAAVNAPHPEAASVGIHEFWHADFLLSTADTPPPDDASWGSIPLPDRWHDPERYERGLIGWYRLSLPGGIEADAAGRRAAYFIRYDMAVEVWFNGYLIADTGRFEEPVTRNWNHPLLVELPAHAWRDDGNVLHVRLRAYPHYGAMAPIFVGPRDALARAWRLRSFVQNDLSEAMLILTLTIAVVGFAFWFPRKRDTVYLYFALASLAYSVFSLNLVVRHVPVPGETWWWFSNSAIGWYAVMLTFFGHRLIGVVRPRLERILLGYAVVATVILAAVDLPTFAVLCNLSHLVSLGIVLYLMVILARDWKISRRGDVLAFALGMALISVLGVHDLMMNTVVQLKMWRDGFFLLNLGAPVVFLALIWHLTRRYVFSLLDAESTNADLEVRVAAARRQLDASFAKRRELERGRAAAEERERIHRDLHDDLGAKLLSLVYAAESDATRGLAQKVLEELRDIVSQSRTSRRELAELAEELAVETAERARTAGLECECRVRVPAGVELGAVQVWHVGRIVREAVSNALRHAAAGRLVLTVELQSTDPARIELVLEDDGHGMPARPQGGRGLTSLRQRTRELGGSIDFERPPDGGTRVRIGFPLGRDEREGEAPDDEHIPLPAASGTITR